MNNRTSSTGIMISRRKNKTPNIHNVYNDDTEIIISSQNKKDAPLG